MAMLTEITQNLTKNQMKKKTANKSKNNIYLKTQTGIFGFQISDTVNVASQTVI